MRRRTVRWIAFLCFLVLALGLPIAIWILGSPNARASLVAGRGTSCAAANRLADLSMSANEVRTAEKAFSAILSSITASRDEVACATYGLSVLRSTLTTTTTMTPSPRYESSRKPHGMRPHRETRRLDEWPAAPDRPPPHSPIQSSDSGTHTPHVPARPTFQCPKQTKDRNVRMSCILARQTALSIPLTFPDQVQDRVNGTLTWLGGLHPPVVEHLPTVQLPDAWKPEVLIGFLFIPALLLLLAWNQLVRWRLERRPGPVVISKIDAPPGAPNEIALAEHMRERLATVGVYPRKSGVSPLGEMVLDSADVLENVAPAASAVGRVFAQLKKALRVQSGYQVSAKAGSGASGASDLTVQLTNVDTKDTIWIRNYEGPTYQDAADEAALAVYLELVGVDEVNRRTPAYLRWTSGSALKQYEDGVKKKKRGDLVGAQAELDGAAVSDPASALVNLERSQVANRLAVGSPTDLILGRDRSSVGAAWLDAVAAALLALERAPRSIEANARAAVVLSYGEQWANFVGRQFSLGHPALPLLANLLAKPRDPLAKQARRASTRRKYQVQKPLDRTTTYDPGLLPLLVRSLEVPSGRLRDDDLQGALKEAVIGRAIGTWWKAERLGRWSSDVARWWCLETRRSALASPLLPRRARWVTRAWTSAAALGVLFDAQRFPSLARADELKEQLDRLFTQVSTRRNCSLKGFVTVVRNMAGAYARAFVYFERQDVTKANNCLAQMRSCLDLWKVGGRTLTSDNVDSVATDPDFQFVTSGEKSEALVEAIEGWLLEFSPLTRPMLEESVWADVWTDILTGAQAQSQRWLVDSITGPQSDRALLSRPSVHLNQMGLDRAAWDALLAWLKRPARVALRASWKSCSEAVSRTPPMMQGSSPLVARSATSPAPQLAPTTHSAHGFVPSPRLGRSDLAALRRALRSTRSDEKPSQYVAGLLDDIVFRFENQARVGPGTTSNLMYEQIAAASWTLWVEVYRFAAGASAAEDVQSATDALARFVPSS
jgi:hypothetical protein